MFRTSESILEPRYSISNWSSVVGITCDLDFEIASLVRLRDKLWNYTAWADCDYTGKAAHGIANSGLF